MQFFLFEIYLKISCFYLINIIWELLTLINCTFVFYITLQQINQKNKEKVTKSNQIITCDVKAGDEQNPLSLDSPGFRRMAGLY